MTTFKMKPLSHTVSEVPLRKDSLLLSQRMGMRAGG